MKKILILSFLLAITTGCETFGVLSTVSDQIECVRVKNLINPDTTRYTIHSEGGIGLGTKKAGFKEDSQHTFKTNSGYSLTHFLVWIENDEGRILNERKDRLHFGRRRSQIGCQVLAISKPGDIHFEFE